MARLKVSTDSDSIVMVKEGADATIARTPAQIVNLRARGYRVATSAEVAATLPKPPHNLSALVEK